MRMFYYMMQWMHSDYYGNENQEKSDFISFSDNWQYYKTRKPLTDVPILRVKTATHHRLIMFSVYWIFDLQLKTRSSCVCQGCIFVFMCAPYSMCNVHLHNVFTIFKYLASSFVPFVDFITWEYEAHEIQSDFFQDKKSNNNVHIATCITHRASAWNGNRFAICYVHLFDVFDFYFLIFVLQCSVMFVSETFCP